jgi:hypothetical protein
MTTEDFEALLEAVDALTDEEALALLKQWRPDLDLVLARLGKRIAIIGPDGQELVE